MVNVKRLAWIPIGPYCLATKKPAKTLEEISALTIRYVSKAEVPSYKALNMKNMSVETQQGKKIGRVKEIFSTGANDVFVVEGKRGEIFLPATEEVVQGLIGKWVS